MAQGGVGSDGWMTRLAECPVCIHRVRNHRMLPCGHLFCQECLIPLITNNRVTCPFYRVVCILTAGLTGLPRNLVLVGVLDRMCERCMEQENEELCHHCNQRLCRNCLGQCKHLERLSGQNGGKLKEITLHKTKVIIKSNI